MANPFDQFDSDPDAKPTANPFDQFDADPPASRWSNIPEAFRDRVRRGELGTEENNPVEKWLIGDKHPNTLLGQALLEPANFATGIIESVFRGTQQPLRAFRGELMKVDPETALPNEDAVGAAMDTMQWMLGSTVFNRAKNGRVAAVGTLPREEDFAHANPVAEKNLRDGWQDDGIHPSEALHDAKSDAFLQQQLETPPFNEKDRGGLARPRNTPVPEGTPRSELAKTGEEHIDAMLDDPALRAKIDNPVINREYDVPYSAGPSADLADRTVYIDRHFPESMTVDGVTYDPADPFVIHEQVEQHMMERLIAAGMDATTAYKVAHHEFANKAEGGWYKAHDIDQAKAEAAYQPFIDAIEHENPERPPPDLYTKPYPHQDVASAKHETAAVPEPNADEIARAKEILSGKTGATVGAARTPEDMLETLPSLEEQPPPRPGSGGLIKEIGDNFFDVGKDLQMMVTPMAAGTPPPRAIAKDFANNIRRNRWEWVREDSQLASKFSPAQRKRMWDALDEESVAEQLGESREHQGLITLEPAERAALVHPMADSLATWLQAVDVGMVDGEGLPSYTPRMMLGMASATRDLPPVSLTQLGRNIFTRTAQMQHRKHMMAEETEAAARAMVRKRMEDAGKSPDEIAEALKDVKIARDIRSLPLATARLKDAIAGRTLINKIEEYGKATGTTTVSYGNQPGTKWFTLDHPAFKRWQNRPEEIEIPAQGAGGIATHEMGFDPALQKGLERVASELGVNISQPLRSQDPYLAANPMTGGYTSRYGNDVVSTFGQAQTTLEHELGHKIDFRYNISQRINAEDPAAWKELGDLAVHRVEENQRALYHSQPDYLTKLSQHAPYSSRASYLDYLLSAEERIANMLHAYWYAPALFKRVAPNASRWFDKFLEESPDALKQAIKSVEPSLQFGTKEKHEQISVLAAPTKVTVNQWHQEPIYVHPDFEGPLRSVMNQPSGAAYGALMALKGKTMGLIMNSPLIHNAVEWGRAFPSMPAKMITFRVYRDGGKMLRDDPAAMAEAIDHGLVPIGKRFFNQDINAIMEEPDLAPGRSLTAKMARMIPDLFDPARPGQTIGGPGDKVAAAIDKIGDFWHNTLLWDQIAKLQAGLYMNFRDSMMASGIDRHTAAYMAAHWANRYAGALPQEAMSNNARKIANIFMFSRSFTLGNLGVMKDMLTGLPRDVMAQIERDVGAISPEAVAFTRKMAARKATAIVAMDIGLMYVANSMLQSGLSILHGDSTLGSEFQGYADRLMGEFDKKVEHPLSILFPAGAGAFIGGRGFGPLGAIGGAAVGAGLSVLSDVASTSENEPGRENRVLVGYAKDGTGIYLRLPFGKIGEEYVGWFSGPLDMIRKKLSTMARPVFQIMANDAGFGRKVYDPNPDTTAKQLWVAIQVAEHLAGPQLPEGQINALSDLVKGEGDAKVNTLQAFGPLTGMTFSKGAPGGPATGFYYDIKNRQQFDENAAMPDIRRQILRGDITGARQRMDELRIPLRKQDFYLRTTMDPTLRVNPRVLRSMTPEQQDRILNAPGAKP